MWKLARGWKAIRELAKGGGLALGLVVTGLLAPTPAAALTIESLLEPFTGGPASVLLSVSDDAIGLERGELLIRVQVLEGGPIRGVFLDVADPSLLRQLRVRGDDVTDVERGGVINLGRGSNLHGGGTPCPCDLGIEIGEPGRNRGSVHSTSFVISSRHGPLDISQFFEQAAGVRLSPESSKLAGTLPVPEPSTCWLLGCGLLALAQVRRR